MLTIGQRVVYRGAELLDYWRRAATVVISVDLTWFFVEFEDGTGLVCHWTELEPA